VTVETKNSEDRRWSLRSTSSVSMLPASRTASTEERARIVRVNLQSGLPAKHVTRDLGHDEVHDGERDLRVSRID